MNHSPSTTWQRIREILDQALEMPPHERPDFLEQACAADEPLRLRLVSILDAYDSGETSFLGLPRPAAETAGSQEGQEIGSWRIERRLGEGGMGTVYLATRSDQTYAKTAALKVLRGSRLSAEAARRFRIERQILADLEHPGIAKLLDGGDTPEGLPFLVMEYVEGEPIDLYCRRHDLDLEARLRLFLEVCAAVQFAHQNLIVHRDLKPSNVLVTAEGSPKLLDFGIAKILQPERFAEPLGATLTGHMPMTPAYASPEQIRAGSITTASDVYSLGLLLYLLITGDLPYRVEGGSLESWVEVICHREVRAPSSRLPAAGATGGSQESRWQRRIRGDLDAIVLKALAKEPERRYATAEQLAEDLDRFLSAQPVRARRSTVAYRAGKFIRRHRYGLLAAAAVFLLLALGIALLLGQRRELIAERNRARTVADWMIELFRMPDPGRSLGAKVTARELLDKSRQTIERDLAAEPPVLASMLEVLGDTYKNLGQIPEAADAYHAALELHRRHSLDPEEQATLAEKAILLLVIEGRYREAEAEAEVAVPLARALGEESPQLAALVHRQAVIAAKLLESSEAEALFAEARRLSRRAGDTSRLSIVLHDEAEMMLSLDRPEAAEKVLDEELVLLRRLHPEKEHPRQVDNLISRARITLAQGKLEQAEMEHREILARLQRLFAGDHYELATMTNNLGTVLERAGRLKEAEAAYREALAQNQRIFGDSHPAIALNLRNLASLLYSRSFSDPAAMPEALATFRRALEIAVRELGPEHPEVARIEIGLGAAELLVGEPAVVRPRLESAIGKLQKAYGARHGQLADGWRVLAYLERRAGRIDAWRQAAERELEAARGTPSFPLALDDYCASLIGGKDYPAAITCLGQVLALETIDRDLRLTSSSRLAESLLRVGRLEEAEAEARRSLDGWLATEAPEPLWLLYCQRTASLALLRMGKLDQAAAEIARRRERAEGLKLARVRDQALDRVREDLEELAAARDLAGYREAQAQPDENRPR